LFNRCACGCKQFLKIKRYHYFTGLPKFVSGHDTYTNIQQKHHIDLNIRNNTKENLLYLSRSEHTKLHRLAYKYLIETKQISNYLEWFRKNKSKTHSYYKKVSKNYYRKVLQEEENGTES
jgi:hypothetical protein